MKIGILYICTGKYKVFWKDFYLSCEKNFIPETEKHYFIFTDSPEIEFGDENKNITRIYQENLGWPDNTLKRYEMFLKIKENISSFDYIFFFNANIIFNEKITKEMFLPNNEQNYVAAIHSGYFNKKINKYPYDRNPKSLAYIPNKIGDKYYQGAINGGRTKHFIEAISLINKNIKEDLKNGIVAKWHDESHWNKFLLDRKDVKILDSSFLYPEGKNIPFNKIILLRDKEKLSPSLFDIRGQKINFIKKFFFYYKKKLGKIIKK
jgi:hypothetical protein